MKNKGRSNNQFGDESEASDCQERLVRFCLRDVENLELAIEHMTEAADCMSRRGTQAISWQKAFCKRMREAISEANSPVRASEE